MSKHHMKLSVRGFLLNALSPRELSIFRDGEQPMSRGQVVDALIKHIQEGHEFLPIGQCNNFDFTKGCMGHPPQLTVVSNVMREPLEQGDYP